MNPDFGVFHIILNPGGGAWSMLRELAAWQSIRMPTAIGIGYRKSLRDDVWKDLKNLNIRTFLYQIPLNLPRTSGILLPPINRWDGELSSSGKARAWIRHFHSGPSIGLGFWPRRPGVFRYPYISLNTFHGVPPRDIVPELRGQFGFVKRAVDAFLSKKMQSSGVRIVALGAALRSSLVALYGLEEKRISIVSNGVSGTAKRGCPRLSPECGNNGIFTVGYLGSIELNKGWEICLQAALALHTTGRKIRFVMVGDGPDRSRLTASLSRANGPIEYLGAIPGAREIIMPSFDALIVPSLHEGQPMVILEALACGIPVIASAVGGIKDTIVHGNTGFLFKPRDVSEIVRLLSLLIDDPELHMRMSRNCYAAWRERFTQEEMGRSYLSLYKEIMLAGISYCT